MGRSAADATAFAARYPEERAQIAERVAAEWQAVGEQLQRSVVPIFRVDERSRLDFEGSGVLLRRGAKHYLCTAAHVIDGCGGRPVLLDGSVGIPAGEPHMTNPPAGEERAQDTLDVGVVLLTEGEVDALGRDRFDVIPPENTEPASLDQTTFALVGFPHRLQRYDRAAGQHEVRHRVIQLGHAEARAYESTGLHPDTHLLLGYRDRNIEENGNRGAPQALRGTSGGGVWRLEWAPSGALAREPIFEGIFTERPDSYKPALMVTRPYVLNEFIDINHL
jgi:hypothetical protein